MIEARLEYRPVLDAMRRAAAEMGDKRPLMRGIAGIMFRAVEDNFEEQGRPRWVDIQPGTKLNRYKTGNWPGKILQRSGRLASSIVQRFDSNQAVVGTNVVYAAIHQFGGQTKPHVIRPRTKRALAFGGIVVRQVNHPGSKIPARPFFRLSPGDLREVVLYTRDRYNRALARNGLQS